MQIIKGKTLGERYEIIRRVGGGGMATVYKARDVLLNRYVAMKVLNESLSHDAEFIRRFSREAQAAASLSHPNIVNVYDVGKDDYTHYIVMELVEGPTLKEYIQENGPLSLEKAASVAVQICEGLSHAHDNQIVHRDIKPHNILLGNKGQVKVTDFGIARAASSSTITQKGSVMGSVHYFSPEQARGGTIGYKSDLYSLGVVLYEMFTGVLPFEGDSAISIALKHLEETVEDPRKYCPEITEEMTGIILKSLKKDPVERFNSAREMIEEIKRVVKYDYTLEMEWLKELKSKESVGESSGEDTILNTDQTKGSLDTENTLLERTVIWLDQVQQKLPLWQKVVFGFFTVLLILGITFSSLNVLLGFWINHKTPFIFSNQSIQIPKFRNEQEAKEWLLKKGFPAPEIRYKTVEGVTPKEIIDQHPSAGKEVVPRDTKVVLTVSALKNPVAVSDYIGQWESRAKSDLYYIEYYYCPGPKGSERAHVFAQEPKPGEKIEKGGKVKVWISIPGSNCKVPPPSAS